MILWTAIPLVAIGAVVAWRSLGRRVGDTSTLERTEDHNPPEEDDSLPAHRRVGDTYTVERTEYRDPPQVIDDPLADDKLEDKNPAFEETLVDSRPLGDWQLNASAAVIRLDCPTIKPDRDGHLLVLHRSYAEALGKGSVGGATVLPSANLLDGAAKQLDDGLYAAIDLGCFRGELGIGPAAPQLVRAVFDKLPAGSPGRPFLAAGLELAGHNVLLGPEEEQAKSALLAEFGRDQVRSKPIAFYDWTAELGQVWRFYRFLQEEFDQKNLQECRAVTAVLESNPDLLTRYRAINGLYGRLTNPLICLPADALIGTAGDLGTLARERGARHAAVAVFPPSTSREVELFERLFPQGLPPGANLMRELVRRIRSGEVDLKPGDKDGWYQYQVYALETLLLPTRGQERDKLQLTARYKKRLAEAFQAMVTKRRETHVRQLTKATTKTEAPLGRGEVRPRLRIEPCPTFYLRTARAYAFLENLLLATVGKDRLARLHGLKEGGTRGPSLADELGAIRRRFYGFYLVSCEDVGMRPQFLKDEPVDQAAAMGAALEWLKTLDKNPDLACDTRVAVPMFVDPAAGKTRLWATLGVRLAPLEADYAKRPRVRPKERPKEEKSEWKEVDSYQLGKSSYVIAVDEFAELELAGSSTLTRGELRALCDQHQTKEEILKALSAR